MNNYILKDTIECLCKELLLQYQIYCSLSSFKLIVNNYECCIIGECLFCINEYSFMSYCNNKKYSSIINKYIKKICLLY